MATNKPRHQKTLSDEAPIVFPVPTSNPSDVFPSDFEQPSDLVVDPYGNYYCFVCQVSVPRGDASVTQHLGGKKHDNHNKRFASEQQKDLIRQRVLNAAKEQRLARAASATELPVASTTNHSSSVQTLPAHAVQVHTQQTSPNHLNALVNSATTASPETASAQPDQPVQPATDPNHSEPSKNTRKAKRLAEARRLRAVQIDKQAFLAELFADDEDSSSESDHAGPDVQLRQPRDDDLSQRQRPFGPLNFKPPEGPDFFFESMAEETTPSLAAFKVRKVLAKKDKILSEDQTQPSPKSESNEDSEERDFLSFNEDGRKEVDKLEEQKRAKARQKARESLIILKDESGEELPPWLLNAEATEKVLYSSDSSISLHYEILEFSQFLSPTQAELDSRNEMLMTIESIVNQLWPSSTIEVFGSYATGLYLPSSDIDICVMGTPSGGDLKEFEQLATAIRNVTDFARRVHVVKAKVNLVKIISRKTSMNCDISIGVPNGPKYIPVIKEYIQNYPALRPLLMVIKCFLRQRNLNEVFSGGLGSYSVLLLVVSHLQMLKYNFQRSRTNLGAVLQQFFQLYGRMHNLCLAGIQVKDNGSYFDKFERYQTTPDDVLRVSIEDPNDVTNELGRNGYAASRVRGAFSKASKTLVSWRRDHSHVPPTPLSAILQPDELFQFRRTMVIEDLEKKGHSPLRESLNPLNRRLQRSGRPFAWSGQKSSESLSEVDTNRTRRSGASASKRQASPDRRRERDPRLAKRRRTGIESEISGNATNSSYNECSADAVNRSSSGALLSSHNSNQPYHSNANVSGRMFNRTMGYGPHNTYNQGGYAPATPGYQYVGGSLYSGNGIQTGFATQNYIQTPQQIVPQQSAGHLHGQYGRNYGNGAMNRGRGRHFKRGYRPRRGNQRGR